MITIYNQTKTPWLLKDIDGHAILSKLKTVIKSDGNSRKYFARIRIPKLFLHDETFIEDIKKSVFMSDVKMVSNKKIVVNFDRSNMRASIDLANSKSTTNKNILLISLFTKHAKVVSIESENVFILDELSLSELFNQFALFNTSKSWMSIITHETGTNNYIKYHFTYDGQNLLLTKELLTDIDDDQLKILTEELKPSKRFKPAVVTEAIIVDKEYESDVKALLKKNESKRINFNVITSNHVSRALEEGYGAVTFYVPVPLSRINEYYREIEKRKHPFRSFFVLTSDYRVKKIKTG